ncbi:LAMI_0F09912g1_1 [Lachancea mirantina]|uniref:LAMI_0F09912g1_1 n=1 Tax=Lachancea mirantina TaxID=1230905 RepID=A0A1G4K1F7_9SACH|nr:LAMI_0F09912g1_1 [Lachancea mirantina]
MRRRLVVFVLSLVAQSVLGQPYEAFSFEEQLPPVGKVGEQFSFQFSNDTLKSNVNGQVQIQYDAFDLPSWLNFDPTSRTLSGEPSEQVLGGDDSDTTISIVLQGTDPSDNKQLNKTYDLLVSRPNAVPEVASNFNLLNLLKDSGFTNGKNGLKLSPGQVFNITFGRNSFDNLNADTQFYGRSQLYHAPLPNWLFFDESDLTFSGTAPVVNSQIAPELDYSFSLIASNSPNYDGAEIVFDLVVGAHDFSTSIQNTLVVNVSNSGEFDYEIPLNYVYLDGNPVSVDNISSVQLSDAPDWVSLQNYSLKGTLTSATNSSSFGVSIFDKYNDVVYLDFSVESTQTLFAVSSLPGANATRDQWFSYTLLPSQFTNFQETNVSVSFSNSSDSTSWLSYHSSNLTLAGTTPNSLDSVGVNVLAQQGSRSQTLSFEIIGVNARNKNITSSSSSSSSTAASSTTVSPSSTVSSTSSVTASASAAPKPLVSGVKSSHKSNRAVAIGCGVAIPLAFIFLCLLALLLWRRKRQQQGTENDKENSPTISGPQLNNPANRPNAFPVVSPFDDENSVDDSSTARRLGALNAMKLDEQGSSASDVSTINEKDNLSACSSPIADVYPGALNTSSKDQLLDQPPNDEYFDSNNRTSSVYFNSKPTNRKSWRYSTSAPAAARSGRESYNSLKTVTTAELMNTELVQEGSLPKDPRKSSLGLRDSVFWGNPQPDAALKATTPVPQSPPVNPKDNPQDQHSYRTQSTSSSDGFMPVKQGDKYEWVEKSGTKPSTPSRKRSLKKLVSLPNRSGVGVLDANDIQGEEPEIDSFHE